MTGNERRELDEVTKGIIGCAYKVGKVLGCGFLEKVYENALVHELSQSRFQVEQQKPIKVFYGDVVVGDYLADIVVNDRVVLELKAVQDLEDAHVAQCLNYLTATRRSVCLLLNFGRPKVQIRRVVQNF